MSSTNARRASGVGRPALGIAMRNVSTPLVLESRLHLLQPDEAAHHQPGADEQDERQRDLCHHQDIPEPELQRRRRERRARAQRAVEILRAALSAGTIPKTIAVSPLTASVKARTPASIRTRTCAAGWPGPWRETVSPPSASTRPRTPPAAASTRLSVASCRTRRQAARAERGAQRHLVLTRGRARQQQVRHVGARDEQHERHRAHERDERRPRVLDDVVLERHDADAHVGRLVFGVLLAELARDAVHLGLRLRERHARLEPAEDREEREVARRPLAVVEPERLPICASVTRNASAGSSRLNVSGMTPTTV